jgi:GNAT superfamily N-acetyltransferase
MAHYYDKGPVEVQSVRWVIGAGGFIGEASITPVTKRDVLAYCQKDRPLAFLSDVRVHPLRRGRGWSDKLLRAVTRHCDRNGIDLWLYAKPFGPRPRPAVDDLARLYRRHGFRAYTWGDYDNEMVRRARC